MSTCAQELPFSPKFPRHMELEEAFETGSASPRPELLAPLAKRDFPLLHRLRDDRPHWNSGIASANGRHRHFKSLCWKEALTAIAAMGQA